MSSVLTELGGFTPIVDAVTQDVGLMSSVVFGLVWRHCQMKDRVCKKSLAELAEMLEVGEQTVRRHLRRLCANGYVKDLTPELRNRPHIYADTGKVRIAGKIVAELSESVQESTLPESKGGLFHPTKLIGPPYQINRVTLPQSQMSKTERLLNTTTTRDEAGQKLTAIYLLAANGKSSQIGVDLVNDILDTYPPETIIYACAEAEKNTTPSDDKRNLAYIEKICKRKASGQPDRKARKGASNGHRQPRPAGIPRATPEEQARLNRMAAALAANDAE